MLPVVGFISRVRAYLKLKQNKTVHGRLKRSHDRRQFCFISVLFQFYFTMCDGLYTSSLCSVVLELFVLHYTNLGSLYS